MELCKVVYSQIHIKLWFCQDLSLCFFKWPNHSFRTAARSALKALSPWLRLGKSHTLDTFLLILHDEAAERDSPYLLSFLGCQFQIRGYFLFKADKRAAPDLHIVWQAPSPILWLHTAMEKCGHLQDGVALWDTVSCMALLWEKGRIAQWDKHLWSEFVPEIHQPFGQG